MDYLFWRQVSESLCETFPRIIWYIWKVRNKKIYENVDTLPLETVRLAETEEHAWKLAQVEETKDLPVPKNRVNHIALRRGTSESRNFGYKCFIDGSWKHSDNFAGLGWFCFLQPEDTPSMGGANLRKSLTPLHAEVEALVWAMRCMIGQDKREVAFFTDCSDLVKMVYSPNEWLAFATYLESLWVFLLVLTFAQVANNDDLTIEILDGDTVDCIDKRKQPAFDHPLLKYHKIQESPSIPKMIKTETKMKWHTQQAHPSVAKCPEGTIPVRRDYATSGDNTNDAREYAIGTTGKPSKLYGAKATINVWGPTVETEDELSNSQIWISSGNYKDENLNTIEVGLQVLPELYQDNKPRLFIYWTSDGYKITGCYNLRCPGFIQTSSDILLGGAITPISTFDGNQFEITISVWKDQNHGNWWLSLGPNNSLVGYWPSEIFTTLANHASEVQWGGEIVNLRSFDRHTTTQMGSGQFPDEGFGKASYFRNLEIVDSNNSFQPVQDLKATAENPKFYKIKNLFREDWGIHFFYGGPGFNPNHSGGASLALSSFILYLSFSLYLII